MTKTIVIILVLVVIGVGGYFVFFNNNSTPTYNQTPVDNTLNTSTNPPLIQNNSVKTVTTSTTTSTTTSATVTKPTPAKPVAASVTISIKNFAFNPATVTVKAGTKVTWVNNDTAPHTVTSDSGSILNSPTLSPGQSFTFTASSAGTINYHCNIHPMMHGTLVVQS